MPGDKMSGDELSQGRIQWGHESLFPNFTEKMDADAPGAQATHRTTADGSLRIS